ncbi:MAG: VOC family protein [Dehalococcoidia bacterium]
MWLRLRQIALVANKLEPVLDDLRDVLGIEVCFRDPGVGRYGLENALLPIGNTMLEVVAPTQEGTAGGRYLERRGGDGGYMVITQCDDHAPRRKRVAELGIRLVSDFTTHEFNNMQMHPKDTGGSFFEIDEQLGPGAHDPDGPWDPAGGAGWKAGQRLNVVSGLVAAELQCDDPAKTAARWAEIAELPVGKDDAGNIAIALADATLRFVPITDGRPEGLGGIDVKAVDRAHILEAAKRRGCYRSDDQVFVCGMRVNLK